VRPSRALTSVRLVLSFSTIIIIISILLSPVVDAHQDFLKRNLANTKKKSSSLRHYVGPVSFQTGISDTMRKLKKELRDAGRDVNAAIRDPTRRRDYQLSQGEKHAKQPMSTKPRDKLSSMKRSMKISKEDLAALKLLDTVHM